MATNLIPHLEPLNPFRPCMIDDPCPPAMPKTRRGWDEILRRPPLIANSSDRAGLLRLYQIPL
jgi:hypothetical protein